MDKIDCVVIGAGVVGLAIAREMALAGHEVIVLEKEQAIGTETSSRNSEVIHAGIYYPTNSLKAKFCVQGNKLLYDYCQQHQIAHKLCGKLIVATNEQQLAKLQKLYQQARDNKVESLSWLNKQQISSLEPALHAQTALLSPNTWIIDSHNYMLSLQGDLEAHDGMIAYNSPLLSAEITGQGIMLNIGGDEPMQLIADKVINSAGLYAPCLAKKFNNFDHNTIPTSYYAKGNYFSLSSKAPFSHLIYPIPEQGGLGVHLTLDLAGQARFGPDVEWVTDINYQVDPKRANSFYKAIRSYWPELKDNSLQAAFSGIRPKIVPAGVASADFRIDGEQIHGIKGLINLYGIESPGLTASLAIACYVRALLAR